MYIDSIFCRWSMTLQSALEHTAVAEQCFVGGDIWRCVCLSVCNRITFESLDVESSFSVCRNIFRGYGSTSYMKVKVKVTEQKSVKFPLPQCNTLTGTKSGSEEDIVVRFACIVGFSGVADRIVWPPSLSCDWKWPRLIKYTHSRWSADAILLTSSSSS